MIAKKVEKGRSAPPIFLRNKIRWIFLKSQSFELNNARENTTAEKAVDYRYRLSDPLGAPFLQYSGGGLCVLLYRVTQKHALLLSVESENVFVSYFALSKLNFQFSYL